MDDLSAKLAHFTDAILEDASQDSVRILKTVESRRRAAIQQAEREALADAYRLIQEESAKIRAEKGREISLHMLENQEALYRRREEIAHEIFAAVRVKLDDFTASPAYGAALRQSFVAAATRIGEPYSMQVYLRPQDMVHAKEFHLEDEVNYVELLEGSFQLGGLIVACPEKHLSFDATYDSALAELTGHFAELVGLSLAGEAPRKEGADNGG